jgi:hypothetical protein
MIIPAHVDKSKISQFIAPSGLHETFKGNPDCLLVFANLVIDGYLKEQELITSSIIHLEKQLKKSIEQYQKETYVNDRIKDQIRITYDQILQIELCFKCKPIRKNDPEKATEAMIIKRAKYDSARRCRKEIEKRFPFLLY